MIIRTLFVLAGLLAVPAAVAAQPHTLVVLPGSKLRILGSTNVNRFTCAATRYAGRDTLSFSPAEEPVSIRFESGSIRVGGRAFDCGNPIMTSDFRQTLKVKEHPTVEIRLLQTVGWTEAVAALDESCNRRAVATVLEVVVAGRARRVELPCEVVWVAGDELRLVGKGDFRFADFGLTPPERLFGTVRVAEAIDVSFDLHLRSVGGQLSALR